MDGDDVAHPDRLRRQYEALTNETDACLVGSLWQGIDPAGRQVRPRDRSRLAARSPFAPFPHGSIMYWRSAFERVGGYRRDADFWEDLDLYHRLADIGRIVVLPMALYQYRTSPLSTRLTSARPAVERALEDMFRQVHGRGGSSRAGGGILSEVFVSLGSTLIWAGRRPGALLPLLRRSALSFDVKSAVILAWAAWGEISPRSLRYCLSLAARRRDRKASRMFPDGGVYDWTPVPLRPAAAEQRSRLLRGPFAGFAWTTRSDRPLL
jgi:hypothetical protein